jgi:hypothetical protein
MKKLATFAFLFFYAVFSFASTVTATITDTDGQTWNNGTWSAVLVSPRGYPTINGTPVPASEQVINGTLSGSGALSGTFADTSTIDQAGATYTFTLYPNASVAPSVISGIAVVGSTVSLSATLSARVTLPRFPAGSYAYGYLDQEILPTPAPGASYYNVTMTCYRQFSLAGWTCGGGGGGGGALFPSTAGVVCNTSTTASQNCTAAAIASVISAQTGCTTAGNVWSPATNTCIVGSGGPGTGTVNTLPFWSSASVLGTSVISQQASTNFIGINQTNPMFPFDVDGHVHFGDYVSTTPNASQDPYVTINRTLSGQTGIYYAHAITDDSTWNCPTCNVSSAIASYDTRFTMEGSVGLEHWVGYQSIPYLDTGFTGTLNRMIGMVHSGFINCTACTVNSTTAVEVDDYTTTTGIHAGINYGIHVLPLSNATKNWGLHIDSNDAFVGGLLQAVGGMIVNRSASTASNFLNFETSGVPEWVTGENPSSTDYVIGSSANAMDCVKATNLCGFPTGMNAGSTGQFKVSSTGIMTNTISPVFNRPSTATNMGITFQTAAVAQWFAGMNASSTDFVIGSSASGIDCVLSSNICGFPVGFNAGAAHQLNVSSTGLISSTVGTAIASATTIAPVTQMVHITGTAAISTITPPPGFGSGFGGCITLIADAIWATATGGNIASPAITAVAATPYRACYDGTSWYVK